MDDRDLSAAEAAYESGDWETAAAGFLAAAEGEEHAGAALHQAGNALMRLRRSEQAAAAYRRASEDDSYERHAAVMSNLGTALSAIGAHEDAIAAFDAALADERYATPYKAMLGRAASLYAMGRYEDAASQYRTAAWADGNPDPGKALNNLGLSFMAMGKPQEAVDAFKAALGLEGYGGKGKASVNLALAYEAIGFHEEAVRAFESARDTYGVDLSGSVLLAYQRSKDASVEDVPEDETASEALAAPIEPGSPETVEGWETADLSTAAFPAAAFELPDAEDEAAARFFNMTEDEMKQADRAARKAERKAKRTPKAIAVRIISTVLVVGVVVGGVLAGLYAGYGYPTQEQTVHGLIDSYRAGQPYTGYWVAVPPANISQEMRALPAKFASYTITGIDRGARTSTAVVSVTLDAGTKLDYDVVLTREGVGWKVSAVKNRWSSTQ